MNYWLDRMIFKKNFNLYSLRNLRYEIILGYNNDDNDKKSALFKIKMTYVSKNLKNYSPYL